MNYLQFAFITHLMATCFMAGLCWFVQIVHYPLFQEIPLTDFPKYERKHFVTGFITIPLMIIELVTGLYLLYASPSTLYTINLALIGIIGLSTIIFQVPIHLKLVQRATSALIDKLIATNWIRTISWTLRVILLSILLSQNLDLDK